MLPEAGDKPGDNVDNHLRDATETIPWWVLHPEFDTIEEYWDELESLEQDDD